MPIRPLSRHSFSGLFLAILLLMSVGAQAQTAIHIDASAPWQEPAPAAYEEGPVRSPSGETIGVNSRYLVRDGKPWLPVMGEFHFSRYPAAQWEEELLKMKASGVNVVATYVIWIHHEEIEGQFDWSGQRDLRAFVQLCAKHGLYVVARIGPWTHGESRNGGFPDWVVRQGPTRENDPVYLRSVSAWYGQIGQQLQGLLWKDGGPIIGVQLENEYAKHGPGAGAEHILELKKIAIGSGLAVPFYFVTGWDRAAIPPRAVLPVYGGYADAPWDASLNQLPPSEVYAFRFGNRVSGNMGMIGAGGQSSAASGAESAPGLPFLTAEIGGGIQDTYHRRPVIHPDDTAAIFPVMLGSGVNLYGTYMYQGGENPEGKQTTLQESQATDYPNDLPVKSYDFQAPLGEFGQERLSLRKMKLFQYFLNSFGSDLAPMTVHAPAELPSSPADFSVPRAAVRSRGDAGFVFFNNYARGYSMPARPKLQITVTLPGGSLTLPQHPIDIPSGAYFIWPFNLQIDGITLRYSTAQLFTRLSAQDSTTTLVFAAVPGIAPEFAFDAATTQITNPAGGHIETHAGTTYVSGVAPGLNSTIELRARDGRRLRVLVLTGEQAENAWRIRIGNSDRLLITKQDFFADSTTSPQRIWLRSRGSAHFSFAIVPPPAAPPESSLHLQQAAGSSGSAEFTAEAPARDPLLQTTAVRPAGIAPPVKLGPIPSWRKQGVAESPAEDDWQQAAAWSVKLPADALSGLSNVFLDVDYAGDVARLYEGQHLLDDNFFNSESWTVGLKRFLHPKAGGSFELKILPLRGDAPVYLDPGLKPQIPPDGQLDQLWHLRLVPEYELTLTVP